MQPCRRCQRPVVFQTPQCPHCGLVFAGSSGDDATMRALLPVGRTPLSIIAGYVGLLSFLVVPAPLALILGIVAVVDLKRQPGKHGLGRAIFAIVMGGLGTVALIALALT